MGKKNHKKTSQKVTIDLVRQNGLWSVTNHKQTFSSSTLNEVSVKQQQKVEETATFEPVMKQFKINNYNKWFDFQRVHSIELDYFEEYFNKSSVNKAPRIYIQQRNFIILLYQKNPEIYLTQGVCRKFLQNDATSITKLYKFLEKHGLINFEVKNPSLPQSILYAQNNHKLGKEVISSRILPQRIIQDNKVKQTLISNPIKVMHKHLRKESNSSDNSQITQVADKAQFLQILKKEISWEQLQKHQFNKKDFLLTLLQLPFENVQIKQSQEEQETSQINFNDYLKVFQPLLEKNFDNQLTSVQELDQIQFKSTQIDKAQLYINQLKQQSQEIENLKYDQSLYNVQLTQIKLQNSQKLLKIQSKLKQKIEQN